MPDPYLSEVKFLGSGNQDFLEIALDAGTDPSTIEIVVYHPNGTVRTTNTLGAPDSSNAGKDIYTIESANSATFNGVHKNGAIAVVQDGNVVQFLSFESTLSPDVGPAAGLTSVPTGPTGQGESVESTDGGNSYSVNTTPSKGTIPCFLAGTLIETDEGPRPVEDIQPGMSVLTTDDGPQTVIWAGTRQLKLEESSAAQTRPIRIPANALGRGQPASDLVVSPNHRILIRDPMCLHLFEVRDVFVAAKFLFGHYGISHVPLALPVRLHHLLLDTHAVITANGMKAESLFNGDVASTGFADDIVGESAIPETLPRHSAPARRVLKAREAATLLKEIDKQATFHLKVS